MGFLTDSAVKSKSTGSWDRKLCVCQRLGQDTGEGNGNPLQYSCLENPMDGGAW